MSQPPPPDELRAEVARQLGRSARLTPDELEDQAQHAREAERFADEVVQSFVERGSYACGVRGSRLVRLEDLGQLPRTTQLEDALDRRRGQQPLETAHRLRLGKLYALIGHDEKAASCFREVLASSEPPPMALVIEVADAAARAGIAALALAGVDRVAETILTRDPGEEHGEDLLRDDPMQAGALLERARDIALRIGHAPRAVALGRAATALYERLSRGAEIRASLAGQVSAMRAAGNARKARLLAERWRDHARDSGAALDEADALETLAGQQRARGQLGEAAALLADAREVFDELREDAEALRLERERGWVLLQDGQLAEAQEVFAVATANARDAGLEELAFTLASDHVRAELLDGQVASALEAARALLEGASPAQAPRAGLLVAEALALAGDGPGALSALLPVIQELEGPEEARALAVQAEVDVIDGRPQAARLLLASAGRLAEAGGEQSLAAELILREGELAWESGDREGCWAALGRAQRLGPQGRVELLAELLQARLAETEEGEELLDELLDAVRGGLREQISVQATLLTLGYTDGAPSAPGQTASLVERLVALREALPPGQRAGFHASALCRPLLRAVPAGDDDPLAALRSGAQVAGAEVAGSAGDVEPAEGDA